MGTPRLFLLDAKKKIIAKQINSEALGEILENEFKMLKQVLGIGYWVLKIDNSKLIT